MRLTRISFVALIGIGFAAVAVPATAAPMSGIMANDAVSRALNGGDSLAIQVQYRRDSRRGRSRHDDRRHGNRGRDRDDGAAAAGLLGGLFLGAIIANQAQQQQQSQRSVEYCMQRFRSYDPRSGTYMGYDGYRHSCP